MSESGEQKELHVLFSGVEEGVLKVTSEPLKGAKFHTIKNYAEFEKFLEEPPDAPIALVICGPLITELQPTELAQTFKQQYPNSPTFFCTEQRKEGFERQLLIKNGFDDAFLFPVDSRVCTGVLVDVKRQFGSSKSYRAVKLLDVQEDTVLDFDTNIFLPMNNKYIKYSAAGDPIEKERVDRLKKHKVNNVYVDKEEMSKFFEYAATRLADLADVSNDTMSETERKERLQGAVRELVTGIFNSAQGSIEEGKQLVEDTREIVKTFIMKSEPSEWYTKLQATISDEGDSYSHATNVSTFAALFAIALEQSTAEDMAIAGMFHDLGLQDVPQEIQDKEPSTWTPDEKKLYEMHPDLSVNIIKERKLIVPGNVQTAIAQHHERIDGTGYPKQLIERKICVEAQILSIADEFDYLTRLEAGRPALSPIDALRKMQGSKKFKADFLKKLVVFFKDQEKASGGEQAAS